MFEKHVMKRIGWEEFCADLECVLLILFLRLLAPSIEITLNCSLISLEFFVTSVVCMYKGLTRMYKKNDLWLATEFLLQIPPSIFPFSSLPAHHLPNSFECSTNANKRYTNHLIKFLATDNSA